MRFAVCIWELDAPGNSIEKLAADGVTDVELGPKPFMEWDDAAIARLSQRFADVGIKIFAAHAPFDGEDNIASPDKKARRKAMENHIKMLYRAAVAGVSHVVVHPGIAGTDEQIRAMETLLPSSLTDLLEVADRVGVSVALENMIPGRPCSSSKRLRELVESISSPRLGICFDAGHAHISREDVNNAFRALHDLTIAIHLSDNDGGWDRHLQPPYGTINWTDLSKTVNTSGFSAPITVEAAPWGGASWKCMLREMDALFTTGRLSICFDGIDVMPICVKCGHYLFGTKQKWFCACRG